MKIEIIESFVAVSQYKSFSKAARSLFITQPTLSSRISSLEEFLEVKLFIRSYNGVKLTKHGTQFLPYAISILNKNQHFTLLLNNFKRNMYEATDYTEPIFKIGISNYLVNQYAKVIIQTLNDYFPNVKYDIMSASSKELTNLLQIGALDYIIYYDLNVNNPNTEIINEEDMLFILSTYDYTFIKENILHVKHMQKPLLLNYNPYLDSLLPHYKQSIDFFSIKNIKAINNYSLIKLLILSERGYSMVSVSIYNHYFSHHDNLHRVKLPNHFSKLKVVSSYSDSLNFIDYSTCLNKIIQNEPKITMI